MFGLLGDIKLWGFDYDINIKDTDFGAFSYQEKRQEGVYYESKKSYCHDRGIISSPQNKKGNKLKDNLKYLEDQMKDHTIIYCQWYDLSIIQLVFNTGLLTYIQVNLSTGDINNIIFDKFLVGKVPDNLSDTFMTKDRLICTQNDNQIVVISFSKSKRYIFDKINKLDPKLSTINLCGPSGRRIDKKIIVNKTQDLILIWWKSTANEVYPWSPAMKEHDRANVHLYRLQGLSFELLCYLKTEFDPLCITFSSRQDNIIHSVEQKVSRKGEVTIEWQTYGVSQQDKLQRIDVISIPLPTHTTCVQFSPNQNMLLLCCIDGSIILNDRTKRTNNTIKAGFIPTLASWHSDGFIFTIGNDRGQTQHFDISLSCIKNQMLNEDSVATNILDLSTYFKNQPALIKIVWNSRNNENIHLNNRDALLLLLFERGPIGAVRIVDGNNLSGSVLIHRYLNLLLADRATSLLLSMNWDVQPKICMYALNQILNHLFKLPLVPERESLIQIALGSFYIPAQSICPTIEDEYGNEIRDLTRKFFYHLIRYQLFEKAFRLAIDLNDHDLFMDIHSYALVINDEKMAAMAEEKALTILNRSDSSHSTCSRKSCSVCFNSDSENGSESCSDDNDKNGFLSDRLRYKFRFSSRRYKRNLSSNQTPPLPVFKSTVIPKSINSSFDTRNSYLSDVIPMQAAYNQSTFGNASKTLTSSASSFGNLRVKQLTTLVETDLKNLSRTSDNLSKSTDDYLTSNDKSNFKKYTLMNMEMNNAIDTSSSSSSSNNIKTNDSIKLNLNENGTGGGGGDTSMKLRSKFPNDTSYISDDNIMSTSFNEEILTGDSKSSTSFIDKIDENLEELELGLNSSKDVTIEVPPPPPAITSSLANYLNSLPKKKLSSTRSTLGNPMLKFPTNSIGRNSSSMSNLLQNYSPSYIESVEYPMKNNLSSKCLNDGNHLLYPNTQYNYQSNFNLQSKLIDSNKYIKTNHKDASKETVSSNIPPLPVINNSSTTYDCENSFESYTIFSEKPKVKFSNTVTHILVPDLLDQSSQSTEKQSLPLDMKKCSKNITESLLQTNGSKENSRTSESTTIKVVHFGLL